jgi:2-polyprenyl-6-methoxyphenol hydroxylase-like FAD-dependent oxidoreductase
VSDVLVLGAGPIGLLAAMMLARDGHDVTVLDRDDAEPPSDARDAMDHWDRGAVPQFQQAHGMHARFRNVLEAELPGVTDALVRAGALSYNQLRFTPFIEDTSPRPGDERFVTVTGRRPLLEAVIANTAADEPRLTVRRGVKVAGLLTGPELIPGAPHVVGVVTDGGEELRADLVVDAMGRRTPMADLVQSVGARAPHVEAADCGFIYYTRYFRAKDGATPEVIGPPLTHHGSLSCLTLLADNDTWMAVLYTNSHDAPLKALRREETWEAVLRTIPFQAHWADGEPITSVMPMSGVLDSLRSYVVAGAPVVTGMVPVGDAWACTNPSLGRGMSIGSGHASLLRAAVREHLGDPVALTEAYAEETAAQVEPWYRAQIAMDRVRYAEMDAIREGREPPPPPDDPASTAMRALATAMAYDADVHRAFIDFASCQVLPQDWLARPGMLDKVMEIAANHEPVVMPGPTREQLLEIVG